MNLILVRHGETEWNRLSRCQGFSDVELNDTGRLQAQALASSLRGETIAAVYSSDLIRAMDTARATAQYHNLPLNTDSDLREMNQGDLEGLTFVEIKERYAELLDAWRKNPESVNLPGGESLGEVQARAWRAISKIYQKHPRQTVIAVSHNFTIMTLLCKFTGVGIDAFGTFKLAAASKTVVDFQNGGYKVEIINDVEHLKTASIAR
ncbi:MAG: histidine phosphatase family protein [Deltaproteobacteria bacterium]